MKPVTSPCKVIGILFILITLLVYGNANSKIFKDEQRGSHRQGKLFSLFNIVQFKNAACTTNSRASGGGRRNGTCFTASECASKSGSASGGCAAGFGVCCLFVVSSSSSNVVQNCTYIQNPGYPSSYTETTSVSYTISKCSSDVCYLRLDFETFRLLGIGQVADAAINTPTDRTDDVLNPCQDQFNVAVTSGQTIPTICGLNTGHHIFIDVGNGPTDTATLSFTFSGASNTRSWEIKVTQYTCSSENAPPNGCLQYFTGLTGRITTFNYDMTDDNHLPNQQYSVCVRQENGYCCVQYMVCVGEANGFSLSPATVDTNDVVIDMGVQDNNCVNEDYVSIPDSSSTCSQTPGGQLVGKYCGPFFTDIINGEVNVPICDCTPPFTVDIYTNDIGDGSVDNPSKGLCLEYKQIRCTG